ncbi:MAG TPA: hypothetical protein VJV79_38025, partial [Polyangiaceae bacterium]|nr:hypothetical protein [Polyangiaceae bacterium]
MVAVTSRHAAAALCGTLVACAGSGALPAPSKPYPAASAAAEQPGSNGFASVTESPQPALGPLGDAAERALRSACGEADAALLTVATQLAERQTGVGELEVDSISHALRAAGAPYVWPRAWLFNGREGEVEAAKARMQRWLGSFSD